MDSSLPVLVSRLADRHALALLVRAALRNEIAQVELAAGPQRAEAHTLDLHVSGQPPLALLAEPAGNPSNGHFPLRLRPLYRAQAAQLYALLASENVSMEDPAPRASLPETEHAPAPNQRLPPPPMRESERMRTAPNGPPRPMIRPATLPFNATQDSPRPMPARHPSAVAKSGDDPRRTAPSGTPNWGGTHLIQGDPMKSADPRRTVPSGSWTGPEPKAPPPVTAAEPEEDEEPHGADADDPSLSVNVDFDAEISVKPQDVAVDVDLDTASFISPPVTAPLAHDSSAPVVEASETEIEIPLAAETDEDPFPADLEEPSLSVSVVFEPDALPPGLTAGLPSPLGDDSPATVAETPPSEVPATIAEEMPLANLSVDLTEDEAFAIDNLEMAADPPPPTSPQNDVAADSFNGFFDADLADFPTAEAPPSEPQPPTDDVDHGAPITTLDDFPDLDNIPSLEPPAPVSAPLPQLEAVPLHEFEADFDINATHTPTDDELQLIDPIDDEPHPPPPPSVSGHAVPVPPPEFDDDDDATLIRMPPKKPPKPLDPVVRPEARLTQNTPTKETELPLPSLGSPLGTPEDVALDVMETQVPVSKRPPPASSKFPIDEDDAMATQVPVSTRPKKHSTDVDVDEVDTTALKKPPVPPAPVSSDPHDPNDPAIGRKINDGKYVIESLIGAGAAGAVYRAIHRELRRTVAIKLLHPHYQKDPHFMTSFRGEALAASQLDHPNVMRVLDFGQEPDGLVYIVMEFLSGRTLQNRLDEERRLPTEKAVEVMIQVCAALSVAHDHGIIHRDIKPDNIMLVPSRSDEGTTFELVKVCDFGIAALQNPHAGDEALAATEHVIAGTPEYMSPEQARGAAVDARADVYACGICLYELTTGRPPFLGNNAAEILIKQLEEQPQPPSEIVKGLDPIIEEIILRSIQKDPRKRHQSAREMRVELKELLEGDDTAHDDDDELSIVENVAVLDDPASGFAGFFLAFSSAVLRFGRFERGHTESATAMKELQKQVRVSLRGRTELTFARRDHGKTPSFCVMSGTAEIVELKRLLGSQLMGSFGEPFTNELVKKGIAALTVREGIPETELHYLIEMLLGPFAHEELRKELLSKPLRYISVLFVSDVVGRDRKLSWKVGLCAARLSRDLRALCNIRGISLKKMRETRDELIGGIGRLLTRGDEVKQFIFNSDLVDEAVANLRGFSSFKVAPLVVERVLHESCAEAATILLHDLDSAALDEQERIRPLLRLFAQRLVTERSPKSDAAVAEFYRRQIVSEEEMPRDLKEQIRAASLADALVRDPAQFLRALDAIRDPVAYEEELSILETAMSTLARRAEATPLMAVMSTLTSHAKAAGKPGPRENAALKTIKWMIDAQRLAPIANTLLVGPAHQREGARQLIVLAGAIGAQALFAARENTPDPAARTVFVQVLRETGPAGWALIAQALPRIEVTGDSELALVEDLLRAMPDRADAALGEAVAKFLSHPVLRQTALSVIVPLWGERAKKPLVEALEYADEPTRVVALGELRRLHGIDEYVFSVLERFLTMKGSAGEDLRVAAAAALADAATPVRTRAVQMLTKVVEGKRGLVALIRGKDENEETALVLESMGRSLLALDRNEGIKALKGRISRAEGATKARLQALLTSAQQG